MKSRRIKLTVSVPDPWHLLRVAANSVSALGRRARRIQLPARSTPAARFPESPEGSDLSGEQPGATTAIFSEIQRPIPLRPLNMAGFHGRVLAIPLSPMTLDDFAATGNFGHLKRLLDRYSHSFDAVYVLSPDVANLTARLGNPKVRHLGMPRWFPARRYISLVLLPFIHRRRLANVTVVRTFTPHAGVVGASIRRRTGARVLVSHGVEWAESMVPDTRLSRFTRSRGLRSADEFIVFSPTQRDDLSDVFPDTPGHVLPAFVDTGMFTPARTTDPSGAPFLIFVGRLNRGKNIPLLFDALEIAARDLHGLRLAVIGDGSLRFQLEQEALSRELPVEFAGAVEHESLPSLFSRAFAYIRAAGADDIPTSLLEAMASGAPCVVAETPGSRRLITNGLSGLLVPPGEPRAMANAIVRLHRQPSLRSRIGTEARRYVVAHYSLDAARNHEVDILLGRTIAAPSSGLAIPVRREEAAA